MAVKWRVLNELTINQKQLKLQEGTLKELGVLLIKYKISYSTATIKEFAKQDEAFEWFDKYSTNPELAAKHAKTVRRKIKARGKFGEKFVHQYFKSLDCAVHTVHAPTYAWQSHDIFGLFDHIVFTNKKLELRNEDDMPLEIRAGTWYVQTKVGKKHLWEFRKAVLESDLPKLMPILLCCIEMKDDKLQRVWFEIVIK